MACKQLVCEGIVELLELVEQNKSASKIFVLCTGKEDPATGQSWCPDCVKADPVIEKCLPKIKSDAVFIFCVVGDRPTWKDPNNPFRTNPKLQLKGIPTLLKWGSAERLGDNECAQEDLVSMLFEE